MKTGIELIAQERQQQIEKHGRSILLDSTLNNDNQLSDAASTLCRSDWHNLESHECVPEGWDEAIWDKMFNKEYYDRLVIAGALIAAEIDRLNYLGRHA